jgi:hypothetical protein
MLVNKFNFRYERDQSFLVPVPAGKSFRVSVPVPSETNFRAGPSQKYYGHGPDPKKTFWSRSCSEKILVLVPSQRDRDHFAHL